MLVIRMQRSGRKGHAMFRVVVQDSRRTPTSGKLVAQLGSYDPHAKTIIIDSEKAQFYLDHGAQPSERLARLLAGEGIKLPKWVTVPEQKQRTVRNADKRRSTRPEQPVEETPAEPEAPVAVEAAAPSEDVVPEPAEVEAPAAEEAVEEAAAPVEETPAEPAEEVAETAEEPTEAPAAEEAATEPATPEPSEEKTSEKSE